MSAALARLATLMATLFLQASWIVGVLSSEDRLKAVRRDWHQWFETGHRLLAGDLGSIYPQTLTSGYFWLYPPYCIYVTAPLGLLSEGWAFIICAATQVAAVAATLCLLRATLPAPRGRYATVAITVLASMPFNTMVVMGQPSGMLALVLAASLWAWRRSPLLAGLSLSLLLAKPTLNGLFPLACLVAGEWRVLGGIGLGQAVLVLSALPLGLERWHEYLVTIRGYAGVMEHATPMWKQLTLYAFWHSLIGRHDATVVALWVASAVPLVLLALAAWRRHVGSPAMLPRLFGLTLLATTNASLDVYFYDGLLLLFPGIAWYLQRDAYHSRFCRWLIGLCILLVFVGGHVTMSLVQGGMAWVALVIAVWLLAEVYDLLAATPADRLAPVSPLGGRAA